MKLSGYCPVSGDTAAVPRGQGWDQGEMAKGWWPEHLPCRCLAPAHFAFQGLWTGVRAVSLVGSHQVLERSWR